VLNGASGDPMSNEPSYPELVLALARRLREVVAPALGSHAGRRVDPSRPSGVGGDLTFEIDQAAEAALAQFVAERAPRLAFYSEDRGLVAPRGDESHVLVVDPIDGTRPAMAGLESACVAVALAPLDGDPRLSDVEVGCVLEIKSGDWFLARRGQGLLATRPVSLSGNAEVESMFWGYGFRGRPARETVELLAPLIDASSVGGGTFELGSQAFAMTRIVTGQLDAVIEVGSRMIDEVPGLEREFLRVGRGAILNNSPYDLAAPWLCLVEAGGVVSDGWGEPLGDRLLLGSGHDFQISSISAANDELHAKLLREVDLGIQRLRALAG
jgi:myo-inositol-1(or 4)-monophosphatase